MTHNIQEARNLIHKAECDLKDAKCKLDEALSEPHISTIAKYIEATIGEFSKCKNVRDLNANIVELDVHNYSGDCSLSRIFKHTGYICTQACAESKTATQFTVWTHLRFSDRHNL